MRWVVLAAIGCGAGPARAVLDNRPPVQPATASREAVVDAMLAALSARDHARLNALAPFADRMAIDYECPRDAATDARVKKGIDRRESDLVFAMMAAPRSKLELIAIERTHEHRLPRGEITGLEGREMCKPRHDLVLEEVRVRVVVRTPGRAPERWPIKAMLVETGGRWYVDTLEPVFGRAGGFAAVARRGADEMCACTTRECVVRAEARRDEHAHLHAVLVETHQLSPPKDPDELAVIAAANRRFEACRAKLP